MEQLPAKLRWGIERRLEFIEFRLFWDGHANRADLTGMFGISIQQASADLRRYLAMAPGNMSYDTHAKAYVRSPSFAPIFFRPDAEQYLSQLRLVSEAVLGQSECWLPRLPPFGVLPVLARTVNASVLRTIIGAIHGHEAVEIHYQSMSRVEPTWRWIEPHAIAHDGFRWHARAFCCADGRFKDFVLPRILETRTLTPASTNPADDTDWHEDVALEIGPHPALSASQHAAIGRDYGMVDGRAEVRVRRALLYYTLKRLGIDTDPSARRPQDQQIVLLNRDAIGAASQQLHGVA
ncbi:WYL domain-containing protein [Azospirillum humicireducens]|uniref:WYL domain-containing protein n=1 Tax=Azospirillum humicireducens TaxID=1226968 RepID=A0A160JDN8_9PROT|nr:WYL domain-containing protein [Azospirillum humicireducens]ANC90830.1 WYL domain-containing protein [Azospirillum humicireducens]